jgi:nucleoside phosphorylase
VSGIGVVVALPREIPAGFIRSDSCQHQEVHPFSVYAWTPAPARHVAVQAGVGRARAAEGARLLIRRFSLQGLVSFGFAGGLAPELARGTLVIGTEVVCEERSDSCASANHDLVEQFHAAARSARLAVQRGRLVTSQHIVADAASRADLRKKSGACAVDMETAGISAVAEAAGLPWVAVRAIVDGATDTLPLACATILREDGHIATRPLVRLLCRSPQQVWRIVRLAGGTVMAHRRLSQVFEHWTQMCGPQRHHEPG